ncbi:MAG: cytochrome c oxidase accessory protein CcoG [Myxococcota bacterium]
MIDARPVEGTFRRLRWWAEAVLIAILFTIPWIRIGDEPLVLLDVPARKFHVFGLVIFPQELYFLWVILAALAVALFFFTAALGRMWCGWACPQTVFTDVFAAVARFIQGWKGSRPPRDLARWRVVATHAVWIALSWVIGFHLVAYFRSPYDLLGAFWNEGRIYPTTAAFHAAITVVAYLDFAVVKQTFCKYLCPYARFQGVLFDRDTLVIGYDAARGEPRGKRGSTQGDCVDCGLCVAVCPTGIDIRDGMQLECIACTQCIDACNGVMERVGRDPELIGYRSLVSLEGLREGRLLRPRTAVYGGLLIALMAAFVTLVAVRRPMDFFVSHNPASLYTTTADGRVGNSFDLRIENRDRTDHVFRLGLEQDEDFELIAGMNPIAVPAKSAAPTRVFVVPRAGHASPSGEIGFVLEPLDGAAQPVVRGARYVNPKEGAHDG